MKLKTKGILLIIAAAAAYPLPGVPSTILIIIGISWIRKARREKNDSLSSYEPKEKDI